MEKLYTTSEAAKILGISTQGVHYRIKKNQLKSIKKNNKVYVYLDIEDEKEENNKIDLNEIIKQKDLQIKILKKFIKQIKKQYKAEIIRLERIQKETIEVFKSEIELLKNAFVELKNVYKLENKNKLKYISLKNFIKIFIDKGYSDKDIKMMILNRIKNKDERFIFDESTNEIVVLFSDFSDLEKELYLGSNI